MLHKRVVATLVIRNGWVVQSIGFERYRPIGHPSISVEFLNRWGIDEIVILDIDATAEKKGPNLALVRDVSKKNFVPLTVGGGIQTLEDIKSLIHNGADKISINKISVLRPALITEAAEIYGNQCIVVSMDVKRNDKGQYEVFVDSGKTSTGRHPVTWALEVERLGAGEILLNSIERDGSKQGYDLALVKQVAEAVTLPIIACGGVGHPRHFEECFLQGNASAAAAGNFFHFSEHSPMTAKAYLRSHGVEIRHDTYADYAGVKFEDSGRIAKRPEGDLEKLRFKYIPEEVV